MKPVLLFVTLFVCGLNAGAQKKGTPPPVTQTVPDRDPVMTIDNIVAGKSKRYHWHSSYATFLMDKPEKAGSFVDISLNGKTILKRYAAPPPKQKARKLKLAKGTNTLVFSPHKSNREDSFVLYMSLRETAMDYHITLQMKKGKNDTLIIIKH